MKKIIIISLFCVLTYTNVNLFAQETSSYNRAWRIEQILKHQEDIQQLENEFSKLKTDFQQEQSRKSDISSMRYEELKNLLEIERNHTAQQTQQIFYLVLLFLIFGVVIPIVSFLIGKNLLKDIHNKIIDLEKRTALTEKVSNDIEKQKEKVDKYPHVLHKLRKLSQIVIVQNEDITQAKEIADSSASTDFEREWALIILDFITSLSSSLDT